MKKSAISNPISCIMHPTPPFNSPLAKGGHRGVMFAVFIAILTLLLLPTVSLAAPQMADYCYLPPFVTDPNTPPNVMFVYEKGGEIIN